MIQKLIIIVVIGVFAFGSNLYAETINVVGEIFPPMTNEDGTGQQFEIAKWTRGRPLETILILISPAKATPFAYHFPRLIAYKGSSLRLTVA